MLGGHWVVVRCGWCTPHRYIPHRRVVTGTRVSQSRGCPARPAGGIDDEIRGEFLVSGRFIRDADSLDGRRLLIVEVLFNLAS